MIFLKALRRLAVIWNNITKALNISVLTDSSLMWVMVFVVGLMCFLPCARPLLSLLPLYSFCLFPSIHWLIFISSIFLLMNYFISSLFLQLKASSSFLRLPLFVPVCQKMTHAGRRVAMSRALLMRWRRVSGDNSGSFQLRWHVLFIWGVCATCAEDFLF